MVAQDSLAVIPWYDERDFDAMLSISGKDRAPGGYHAWMREAAGAARRARDSGAAVQFISVKPQDYRRWLGDRQRTNSAVNRVAFLRELVAQQRLIA